MRLTKFSDYALRALIFAGSNGDKLVTIEETAELYSISRAHLKKVILQLTQAGFLRGVRGRSGGFTLALPPDQINLGAVLRVTEPDFAMVDCFHPDNRCLITRPCRLPNVINEALAAFMGTFDRHSLADIMVAPRYFGAPPTGPLPLRGPQLPPHPA